MFWCSKKTEVAESSQNQSFLKEVEAFTKSQSHQIFLSKRKLSLEVKEDRSFDYQALQLLAALTPLTGCLQYLLIIAGYTKTHPYIISRLMSPQIYFYYMQHSK